jgi:hypothetical protein
MGKQAGANLDTDWGAIQIIIFPAGTAMPIEKPAPVPGSAAADAVAPVQVTAAAAHTP